MNTNHTTQVIEVGDITDEQALAYLLRHKVPKERAVDAVANITGGRLIRLNNYRNNYVAFPTNAECRKLFDVDTSTALLRLKLPMDHPFFKSLVVCTRMTPSSSCPQPSLPSSSSAT